MSELNTPCRGKHSHFLACKWHMVTHNLFWYSYSCKYRFHFINDCVCRFVSDVQHFWIFGEIVHNQMKRLTTDFKYVSSYFQPRRLWDVMRSLAPSGDEVGTAGKLYKTQPLSQYLSSYLANTNVLWPELWCAACPDVLHAAFVTCLTSYCQVE